MQEQFTDWIDRFNLSPWMWNLIVVIFSILTGLLFKLIISLFFRKKAKEEKNFSSFRSFLKHLGTPLTIILPFFVFNLLLPVMHMPVLLMQRLDKTIEIILTIVSAWILIRIISIVQDYVYYKFDISKTDNLRERKIRTQLQFIRKILIVLIVLLTIAVVLLSFNTMRKIGTGLITGVGVSGIIIGFAAQRSLANLLAGFQIAFTQPIRIDDAVLVENEFGIIEEINLTYVVVRIWDERRLVLPINYFIEKPFQNWTRHSAQLLATVLIYTDYSVPVNAVREELTRLLLITPLWDKRVNGLQVTNATEHIVELRALMSASNSAMAFDLRCFIREKLIEFIKNNYPESLPKTRVSLINEPIKDQTNR
ncbi:MAG TPA: mechanosensitive ion channel domain-containing protein [Flavisolibacter sp.]|nr:mechanosensitive ion channel domain-containing protein [Flavisolibacter sp.]